MSSPDKHTEHRAGFVNIIGNPNVGKSTLMNQLGCLDVPTSGDYFLSGQNVAKLSDNELSDIRNREIGFIFQGFNLIPNLTVPVCSSRTTACRRI